MTMEHKENIHEKHHHEPKKQEDVKKISEKNALNIPGAILLGAIIIGGGLYLSKTRTAKTEEGKPKSAVELAGISTEKFKACYESGKYSQKVKESIESAARATAHIPAEEGRGTPYSIVVTKDGRKAEIAGAYPIEAVKGIIDELVNNPTKNQSEITVDPVTENEHIFGNKNADVLVIEYSDLECSFCARFHQTMHQVIADYNGKVAWVYRHLPLQMHENAEEKAVASECVAEIGGNEAFWKYVDATLEEVVPKKKAFDPLMTGN